jgi:chromosome segregation protein
VLAEHREREAALRVSVSQLAGREATLREAIQSSDHRLSDLRQSVQKVQAELERLLERREQMGVQLREVSEEAIRVDDDLRLTGDRVRGIAGERATVRAALAEAERLVAERRQTADEVEAQVDLQRSTLADERDRLEALRLEQVRIAAERADLTRSAAELRERSSQLARRAERLAAELAQAEGEAAHLASARADLEGARERTTAELASLATDRARMASELSQAEQALGDAETRLGEARLGLAARNSSLEALRALERVREGYGAGVRAIFNDGGGPRVAGVVGTVADLLDVPRELERAVEAVLGERLEWVVVERFDHARAAVRYLESNAAGAATFVPLENLHGDPRGASPHIEAAGNGHGDLDWLARHVAGPAPALLEYLLGQVAVVDHLDQAETLWRRNGVVATYVTPSGEVLAPTGRLRGGAGTGGVESSLLARKRQARELEDEVRALDATVREGQGECARYAATVAELRTRIGSCEQQLGERQALRLTSEKDLEQVIREHERVQRHCATVRLEATQVASEADETATVLTGLEQRIARAREAEAGQEATVASLRQTIDRAQAEEAALVAELTTSRVELASVTERVEALGRELARIDQMETELGQRLTLAETRKAQLAERKIWLVEERERTDTAARDVAAERDRVEADARQAADHHDGLLTELRQIEGELRGVESDLHRVVNAMHELELQATERRVRREELAQEVLRTYGVEEAQLREHHEPGRELDELRRRLTELEDRLTAIGPVNLVADEEYRELDERLTFLRTQHDDLTASIKDLDKALRGMTRTAQERFLQAFDEINRDFGQIFERLFEGGRAELRMVEAEEGGDPLDTGVELMAQPRGKRLQSVTLLSGGERALTGLALLFAIFYFRPSPFCVLDEVDAPLDDANIHRFLRVLRELTSRTQFLVITHNRRTMEAADLLYGVTMEEPGLSKLVAVKLNS